MKEPAFELDLRDLMDAHYGAKWTQRTGVGQGSDIGPALTDGLKTLRTNFGRGKILIPPGSWLMTKPPSPDDLSGHVIEGCGSMASKVIYNSANGVAFRFNGAGGYTGGGIRGLGILLESGLGNTNAYGIAMIGNATYQQDQTFFEDIYMTSIGANSFWWDGFHVDGSARSHPQGCRIGTMTQVEVFNCHNVGIYLANVVGWDLRNVGVFTGQGTNGNSTMIVGGSTEVTGSSVWGTVNVSGTGPKVIINGITYS
jgi:hypothetical protein